MIKKLLLFCILLSLTSCHKDNPVSSKDGEIVTTDNKWIAKTSMPTARGYFCSAEVNGKIYLMGGILDLSFSNSDAVEVYDPGTDNWTTKHKMPEKIFGMAAAAVSGKIYTFGGRTGSLYSGTTLNYTYLYNPSDETWTRKKDMPESKAFLTASVIDGKIYTIGGCSEGYVGTKTVYMYDPATDTWTARASLPPGRGMLTSLVFNGKIYVTGGGSGNDAGAGNSLSYFEVYDPATDSWDLMEDLTQSRWGHGCRVINNRLYICGGVSAIDKNGVTSVTLLKDLMEYDFSSGIWTTKASMPFHRRCFETCVYNNKLFVFGGFTGDVGSQQILKSVLEYIPPGSN